MPRPYREAAPHIREWRLVRGLTQAKLAERVEVQQPMISDIERGTHFPTHETLKRMAKALRVPVDGLFTDPFRIVRAKVDRTRRR